MVRATMTVLSAIRDPGMLAPITNLLNERSDVATVERQQPGDWQGLTAALDHGPEILLLEYAAVADRLTDLLREAKKRSPHVRIIIVHPAADSQCILQSMRAGAEEFIHAPFAETFGPAFDRVVALCATHLGETRQGKVIGFMSAKGGCGATTLACHVAAELHRQTHQQVLVADLDLDSGMAAFVMKMDKPYSVLDVIENRSRLDESLWKALVAETKPGLAVLPAPHLFSHEQYPGREGLTGFVSFVRSQYDWVILDLGRSLNSIVSDTYDSIDQIMLVSVLEAAALHGVKTILRRLNECGKELDRLRLVVNRAPKMLDISSEELARILGRPIYATVPNDYKGLQESYGNGGLLETNSRLSEAFAQLAARIANLAPQKPKKRFGLFA
jgi:pilus assembly protein CpaE